MGGARIFGELEGRTMNKALIIIALVATSPSFAAGVDYRSSNTLNAEDYLFSSGGKFEDPVFANPTINLDIDIGVTSDCGRIDIRNTMQAALRNILDSKYLERLGHDIAAASPMLVSCYFSPTWCAILKNFQLQANMLAKLRLDQCRAIDRFVDGRVQDFHEERSKCVRDSINANNGNFEKAMDQCQNHAATDFASWAGEGRKKVNRMIESTAEWAGFTGEEAKRVVDLTKAFIGDDIVQAGGISMDYGPKRIQFTPRTYLLDIKKAKYESLCQNLLPKVVEGGGPRANVYSLVSDRELQDISGSNNPVLDRQTLMSLAYLPYQRRKLACRKLSEALALGAFTDDMAKTLDFISSKIGTNPHIPPKNKTENDLKRRAFKDQIELTLSIENQKMTPLNQVLYQINKEGAEYRKTLSKRELFNHQDTHANRRVDHLFFDCGDGIGCDR